MSAGQKARRYYRLRLWILAVTFVAAVALLLFQRVIGPRLVKRALNSLIVEPCQSCLLEIGEVVLTFWGPGITVRNVNFATQAGEATMANARIRELTVAMHPLELFRRKLHITAVEVTGPEVIIVEKEEKIDPRSAVKRETKGADIIDSVEIDGISIVKGDFSYIHEKFGKQALIQVHEIALGVERFGTTNDLRLKKVFGRAEGMLEHSGKFELKVDAVLFGQTPDVDVDLKIRRQVLEDLLPFFLPEAGLKLSGLLHEGEAKVAIRENRARATVSATFEKLEFDVKPTPTRTGLQAFIANLVTSLGMGGQNLYDKPEDRKKTAELTREADESVIAFILRAMKEAALKIPTRTGSSTVAPLLRGPAPLQRRDVPE